jgi:cytochrome P450
MRLSVEGNAATAASGGVRADADPTAPDLRFLFHDSPAALRSFYSTVERILADNPVDPAAAPATLRSQAIRQGRAVASVIGFFLRFRPYPMLEEVRGAGKLFQPPFGPLLVVEGQAVRELLERDQEFTVEPYGVEMARVMTPRHNGGFTTFILSTDDDALYRPDRQLLSAVCTRDDAARLTQLVHDDCMRRLAVAVDAARAQGSTGLDVVHSLARYVPVTLGHAYLGVPVAPQTGSFELTADMLEYYGEPIDGDPETALRQGDGVIPDERQMYGWIKAAFRHFFNNVEKDPGVRRDGFRACRQLLAYLLREIDIQRGRIEEGQPVADTMLTRLVNFQLGQSTPTAGRPADLDPRLVTDLRIAENVMGTIVGAVAGQEEATCRVIDSMLRLKDGEWRTTGGPAVRYGSYDEARQLALNVVSGIDVAGSREGLHAYFLEALRLQPQGEVLLRKCARDGAQIAGSRPMAAGTLVFASHGSAMQDVPEPDAFILNRPREHYLQYGWGRHTCLGQYVSPVIIVESMIALLSLEGLRRAGPFALDAQNLYADSFMVQFSEVAVA